MMPPRSVLKNLTVKMETLYPSEIWNNLTKQQEVRPKGLYLNMQPFRTSDSTRSPFVTLLSRSAQSGRWSSFGKRLWFTESHNFLIISFVLFTQFIVDKMKKKSCCIKFNKYIKHIRLQGVSPQVYISSQSAAVGNTVYKIEILHDHPSKLCCFIYSIYYW